MGNIWAIILPDLLLILMRRLPADGVTSSDILDVNIWIMNFVVIES